MLIFLIFHLAVAWKPHVYCKLSPVLDKLKEFAKFILKLLFDGDLRNELWSQQNISKWHSLCFRLEEWSGPNPQFKLFHHSQSMRR